MQRLQDLLHGTSGQVGAADRAGEKRVARDEFLLGREVEADAALGMSGRVQDAGGERSGSDGFSGAEAVIDFNVAGRGHADPSGLDIQHFQKIVIVLIEQDGSASGGAKLHRSADVVDVGVSNDDLLDQQVMLAQEAENILNVVAGIDDHGFPSGLVADDGAVTLQRADGNDFVDHGNIVASERGIARTCREGRIG